MWISRIKMDLEKFSKTQFKPINDLYDEHKLIWRFFVDQPLGTRPFLYRRENQTTFIIVSNILPVNFSDVWVLESKPYNPVLRIGQQLKFTIRVNPIISHCDSSKKHDVKMDAIFQKRLANIARKTHQEELQTSVSKWLIQRQSINGFEVVEELISVDEYLQHRIKEKEIPISTCNISGKLVVIDPDKCKHLLFNGIGKAKGFGCGLMLVSL